MDVEGISLVGQRKNGKIFLVWVLGGETRRYGCVRLFTLGGNDKYVWFLVPQSGTMQ